MTAIWTAPRTWNVGELVTAGLLNTHVRDNLEFLKAQVDLPLNHAAANIITLCSTTSTSHVDVDATNLKLTLSTGGGTVLLGFNTFAKHTLVGGEVRLDWNVDGVRLGDPTYGLSFLQMPAAVYYNPVSHVQAFAMSAGVHTIKLQFATGGGTLSIGGIAGGTSIWALELV